MLETTLKNESFKKMVQIIDNFNNRESFGRKVYPYVDDVKISPEYKEMHIYFKEEPNSGQRKEFVQYLSTYALEMIENDEEFESRFEWKIHGHYDSETIDMKILGKNIKKHGIHHHTPWSVIIGLEKDIFDCYKLANCKI